MKKGDKVRLTSGGPVMTVKQYPYKIVDGAPVESKAECEWFDKEDQLHHSTFELDVLEEVQAYGAQHSISSRKRLSRDESLRTLNP